MRLVFVHLKGSKKGQAEVFEKYKILIGTHPSCDLSFSEVSHKDLSSFHAEIVNKGDSVTIKDLASKAGTFVNNEIISEIVLKDGDVIGFAEGGPEVCIRVTRKKEEPGISDESSLLEKELEKPSVSDLQVGKVKSATQDVVHYEKPGILQIVLRDFIKKPYRKASSKTKKFLLAMILMILGVSFSLLYFYSYKLHETSKRVEILESQQSFIENIIDKYRKGVCFIQGSYYYVDTKTGKPIRAAYDGTPITSNFSGTGFLVSSKGIVLTNRHIAEPSWRESKVPYTEYYGRRGTTIKFEVLRAFFPEIKDPFPLEIVKVSTDVDIAILKFEPNDLDLPVFNLDMSGKNVRIGEPVILLGYPAGINAFFGKTDQKVVDELIMLPVLRVAEELSMRKLIRPLATQGHVTDFTSDKIIYDAQTTVGGSGGPLININGDVIGINYGILRSFKGSNFAVPIKFGVTLLQK